LVLEIFIAVIAMNLQIVFLVIEYQLFNVKIYKLLFQNSSPIIIFFILIPNIFVKR